MFYSFSVDNFIKKAWLIVAKFLATAYHNEILLGGILLIKIIY